MSLVEFTRIIITFSFQWAIVIVDMPTIDLSRSLSNDDRIRWCFRMANHHCWTSWIKIECIVHRWHRKEEEEEQNIDDSFSDRYVHRSYVNKAAHRFICLGSNIDTNERCTNMFVRCVANVDNHCSASSCSLIVVVAKASRLRKLCERSIHSNATTLAKSWWIGKGSESTCDNTWNEIKKGTCVHSNRFIDVVGSRSLIVIDIVLATSNFVGCKQNSQCKFKHSIDSWTIELVIVIVVVRVSNQKNGN
jgi:hypothetical protein